MKPQLWSTFGNSFEFAGRTSLAPSKPANNNKYTEQQKKHTRREWNENEKNIYKHKSCNFYAYYFNILENEKPNIEGCLGFHSGDADGKK